MSSPATPAAASDTPEKAPRKFPPPCWTQEETLVLIEAYRERWYALRRGYLRTADWDAVATAVTTRCPDVTPAKTSAQCRHKMEKLRQRYRAEKQRALSYPYPAGRYFSSWFFFENMEAMENGTTPGAVQVQDSSDGSKLKSFLDDSILKLKLKAKTEIDSSPGDFGIGNGIKGYRSRVSSDYSAIGDVGEDEYEEKLMNVRRVKPLNGIPIPQFKTKVKNSGRTMNSFDYSGSHGEGMMLPPGPRVPNFDPNWSSNTVANAQFMYEKNRGLKPKQPWDSAFSSGVMNGSKRGRDDLEEIAASIRVLSEGYVKMERAKMEMAREMEENRMEMEMKRNAMLLESQKQIVDAFVKGFSEMKKASSGNKKVRAAAGVVEAGLAET